MRIFLAVEIKENRYISGRAGEGRVGDEKAAGVAVSQVSLYVISGSEGKDREKERERGRGREVNRAMFIG